MNHWQPIMSAPKNATEIEVKMKDGEIYPKAHWASDLSGEEHPPFQGWFVPTIIDNEVVGYSEIAQPIEWRPIQKPEKR